MSAKINPITKAKLPATVAEADIHRKLVKKAFRDAGVPTNILSGIETRALRSGRRQTGAFKSNRDPRWNLTPSDPQYGTELDCKIIQLRLMGMLLQFDGAPKIASASQQILETHYLGGRIKPGRYRDSLLLEHMSYPEFVIEAGSPTHGASNFHIGHEDPTMQPKHVPGNVSWRSHRSNLIQGNMTLRQARIYVVKLIGRYFELGELEIS